MTRVPILLYSLLPTVIYHNLILQSICNGRGMCGCEGTCECENPYFGQFCELCSGSEVCFDTNCDSNRDCANCALDIIVEMVDSVTVEEFFQTAASNPDLPEGSDVTFNPENNAFEVTLPRGHCPSCDDGVVIINGTERADYEIDGECSTFPLTLPFIIPVNLIPYVLQPCR